MAKEKFKIYEVHEGGETFNDDYAPVAASDSMDHALWSAVNHSAQAKGKTFEVWTVEHVYALKHGKRSLQSENLVECLSITARDVPVKKK